MTLVALVSLREKLGDTKLINQQLSFTVDCSLVLLFIAEFKSTNHPFSSDQLPRLTKVFHLHDHSVF